MRKAAGKRLPHGTTRDLVLIAMWKLHLSSGRPELVSRAQLVEALNIPETTIDDRLRVLVKSGEVLKKARGLYVPSKGTSKMIFDRYWVQRWEDRKDVSARNQYLYPKRTNEGKVYVLISTQN